ncbi:MAG: restriction endonuclease subunit S [Rhodocyclaceae bacterium]|nr:MAG: restriction endonuclease subunit S [Rhodocyclaceae bacterium]
MSFPCYPEYKDSGVEWLGEVPGHWEVKALKNVISRIESGVSVNAIDTPAAEGEIGVLKTSCVYRGWFDPAENKAVVPEEYERVACPVTAGTLIVSRMNTPDLVGAAGMVGESHPGLFLPDRLWQVHFADAHAAFIHYWTHSPLYRAQVQQVCAGASSSMQNLAQDQFRAFILALPPVREQTAIAAFLDRETAKIDALVAEQQNLIVLLKEKRQALISHAVTKGLDPDVPMKDSGVAWLGEVPAHWEIWKIAHAFGCIGSGTTPPSNEPKWYDEGEIPWVTTGELRENLVTSTAKCVTREAVETFSSLRVHPTGSLVIAMYGATIGRLGVLGVDATTNQACCVLSSPKNLDVPFVFHWLSAFKDHLIDLYASGGGQPNINQEIVASLRIPAPSTEEQVRIVAALDQEVTQLQSLVDEAESTIALLQERRTALISAAVTGKIDVRHLAAASAEPTPEPA